MPFNSLVWLEPLNSVLFSCAKHSLSENPSYKITSIWKEDFLQPHFSSSLFKQCSTERIQDLLGEERKESCRCQIQESTKTNHCTRSFYSETDRNFGLKTQRLKTTFTEVLLKIKPLSLSYFMWSRVKAKRGCLYIF